MIEAQKELERIEHQKRTWNSKFMREKEIFMAIVIHVNGNYKGEEKKHWNRVIELYHKKYSDESQ